jgi:hypothetical protein
MNNSHRITHAAAFLLGLVSAIALSVRPQGSPHSASAPAPAAVWNLVAFNGQDVSWHLRDGSLVRLGGGNNRVITAEAMREAGAKQEYFVVTMRAAHCGLQRGDIILTPAAGVPEVAAFDLAVPNVAAALARGLCAAKPRG